jgi:hypothetical protein
MGQPYEGREFWKVIGKLIVFTLIAAIVGVIVKTAVYAMLHTVGLHRWSVGKTIIDWSGWLWAFTSSSSSRLRATKSPAWAKPV